MIVIGMKVMTMGKMTIREKMVAMMMMILMRKMRRMVRRMTEIYNDEDGENDADEKIMRRRMVMMTRKMTTPGICLC